MKGDVNMAPVVAAGLISLAGHAVAVVIKKSKN